MTTTYTPNRHVCQACGRRRTFSIDAVPYCDCGARQWGLDAELYLPPRRAPAEHEQGHR